MKRLIVEFMLILLSACTSIKLTQLSNTFDAKITQYGIYYTQIKGHVESNSISQDWDIIDNNFKLIHKTDSIPCQLGICFGIKFNVTGIADSINAAELVSKWEFPKLIRNDGYIDTTTETSHYFTTDKCSLRDMFFEWTFEQQYELVPGNWKVSVLYKGRTILEKTFHVYQYIDDRS